jgi:hypothetical protein
MYRRAHPAALNGIPVDGLPHRRFEVRDMLGYSAEEGTALVAASTAAAAHRRDHHHVGSTTCEPHAVEVVHLGHRAVTVCHDCESDSGFLPEGQAEAVASAHRDRTSAVRL